MADDDALQETMDEAHEDDGPSSTQSMPSSSEAAATTGSASSSSWSSSSWSPELVSAEWGAWLGTLELPRLQRSLDLDEGDWHAVRCKLVLTGEARLEHIVGLERFHQAVQELGIAWTDHSAPPSFTALDAKQRRRFTEIMCPNHSIGRSPFALDPDNERDWDWLCEIGIRKIRSAQSAGPVMWYNAKTHQHRWQLLTADEVESQLRAIYEADGDHCPFLYDYPLETGGDVRVLSLRISTADAMIFEWQCEAGQHSVPTTMPSDPRKEKWGSAAADQALLALRAVAARDNPTPAEAQADLENWRCCARGGVVSMHTSRPLRDSERFQDFWDFGTHKLLLPRNGMVVHNLTLDWKQEPEHVRPGKTWRCMLSEWTERDRRLLVDMARGFTVSKYKPPVVTHGAVRIKGYPWDTRKRPPARTPTRLNRTGELHPAEDGTDSELEGLFVFSSKQSVNTLQEVLPGATWTPVTMAAWEEEVQHFGLFDLAFDYTRCSRADPELDHWIEMMWARQMLPDEKGAGSRGGKTVNESSLVFPDGQLFASPLSATETHAVLLASNPNGQLMYNIERINESGAWPASIPFSAAEALRMLQLEVEHWGSFFQVRDALGRVRADYDKYFGHHGESSGEQIRKLQDIEAMLQGRLPSELARVSLAELDGDGATGTTVAAASFAARPDMPPPTAPPDAPTCNICLDDILHAGDVHTSACCRHPKSFHASCWESLRNDCLLNRMPFCCPGCRTVHVES